MENTRAIHMLPTRAPPTAKDHRLKGQKMIFQAIENKKNPGVSKFVSDKIDFKTKAITRQRRNFKYNRQDMKTIYMYIER